MPEIVIFQKWVVGIYTCTQRWGGAADTCASIYVYGDVVMSDRRPGWPFADVQSEGT